MLLSGLTTLGKTVVIIVAATFIAWALITAIFMVAAMWIFPEAGGKKPGNDATARS